MDQDVFVAGVSDLDFPADQAFLVLVCLDEVNVFAVVEGLARNTDGIGDLSDGDADLAEDAREKDLGVDEVVVLSGAAAEVNANPQVDGTRSQIKASADTFDHALPCGARALWDFDADSSEFSQIGGDLIDGDLLVLFVADLAEIFERKGDGDLDGLGAFEGYDTTTCCDKSPVGRGSLGDTRIKGGI